MKKLLLFTAVFLLLATPLCLAGYVQNTPLVRYVSPRNDSEVNLKAKESLTFSWKGSPIPGGGRSAYKFTLYKEFSYEVIAEEKLHPNVTTTEVPVEKFENGSIYSWQVKQRDEKTRKWNSDCRWSFKVIK